MTRSGATRGSRATLGRQQQQSGGPPSGFAVTVCGGGSPLMPRKASACSVTLIVTSPSGDHGSCAVTKKDEGQSGNRRARAERGEPLQPGGGLAELGPGDTGNRARESGRTDRGLRSRSTQAPAPSSPDHPIPRQHLNLHARRGSNPRADVVGVGIRHGPRGVAVRVAPLRPGRPASARAGPGAEDGVVDAADVYTEVGEPGSRGARRAVGVPAAVAPPVLVPRRPRPPPAIPAMLPLPGGRAAQGPQCHA